MKRIMIIGCAGTGKSSLSLLLGSTLDLPVYHLDKTFWKPNWERISAAEWIQYQTAIVQEESWIIDGNYSNTMEIRFKRANVVVYLDFPRALCLWRVIKRRFQYHNRARPDLNIECKEKIDLEFLQWIWNYPKRSKPKTKAFLKYYASDHVLIHVTKKKHLKNISQNIQSQLSH